MDGGDDRRDATSGDWRGAVPAELRSRAPIHPTPDARTHDARTPAAQHLEAQNPDARATGQPGGAVGDLSPLIEATSVGIGTLERMEPVPGAFDHLWINANPALVAAFGGTPLIGRSLIHDGADGGMGAALAMALERAMVGDGARPTIMTSRDGNRHRVIVHRLDVAGRVGLTFEAAAGVIGDPLRQALEHTADAVALFDQRGHLVDFTGPLKEMLPELAHHEATHDDVRRLFSMRGRHADDPSPDGTEQASSGNSSRTTFRSPGGRWILNKEWRTPEGGVVCVLTDITQTREREEALRASEVNARRAWEEAERASRAKSDFLAHMSHELRTPLNAIIGFADLMIMEAFGPLGHRRYKDYAGDVLDSGRHLLELVEDALNLSKIDSGKHQLVEEMLNPHEEVAAAITRIDGDARRKGIVIATDVPTNLPPLVADRRAIHQMLNHLLSNAVKFTPNHGRVQISASQTPDGGLGVMVADTGMGIAPEDIERVVEPFGRTEMSRGHAIDGTGLGLPIVKRLIELHGGQLDLESELDSGTTVILTFPPSRVVDPRYLPIPMMARGG